jgi:hypothetical protein
MRYVMTATLLVALTVLTAGCGRSFPGPTVDAFTGRVVKEGKPVSLPDGERAELKVIHQKTAQSFGIPLTTEGSFKIGWMPIGKFTAILIRTKENAKGGPNMYNVPGGFEIVEGKTDYEVELGKGWKP